MWRRGDVINFFFLHNLRRLSLSRPRFLSPLATNCANIGPKRWRWNLEFCASDFSKKNWRYVTSPEGGEVTLETSASLSCYDHNLTLINFNVSQFSCFHFQWTFPADRWSLSATHAQNWGQLSNVCGSTSACTKTWKAGMPERRNTKITKTRTAWKINELKNK